MHQVVKYQLIFFLNFFFFLSPTQQEKESISVLFLPLVPSGAGASAALCNGRSCHSTGALPGSAGGCGSGEAAGTWQVMHSPQVNKAALFHSRKPRAVVA